MAKIQQKHFFDKNIFFDKENTFFLSFLSFPSLLVSAKVGAQYARQGDRQSDEIELEKWESKREAGRFYSSRFFLSQTSCLLLLEVILLIK